MKRLFWTAYWFFVRNRVGYCEDPRCGAWTWRRDQPINRSTASAWMCEPCAAEEQLEVDAAWAEYYAGCW